MKSRLMIAAMTLLTGHPAVAGTLSLTFSGGGSGSVNSDPPGLSCTSGGPVCTAPFADGTGVTLLATPDWKSLDGVFGGACSGTGSCTVTVTGETSVSLSFSPNLQAALIITHPEIEPKFATLSDAYAYAVTHGKDNFPLNARVHTFFEDLILTSPVSFTLAGGKDDGWYTRIGETTLAGTLEIGNGSISIDTLVIR